MGPAAGEELVPWGCGQSGPSLQLLIRRPQPGSWNVSRGSAQEGPSGLRPRRTPQCPEGHLGSAGGPWSLPGSPVKGVAARKPLAALRVWCPPLWEAPGVGGAFPPGLALRGGPALWPHPQQATPEVPPLSAQRAEAWLGGGVGTGGGLGRRAPACPEGKVSQNPGVSESARGSEHVTPTHLLKPAPTPSWWLRHPASAPSPGEGGLTTPWEPCSLTAPSPCPEPKSVPLRLQPSALVHALGLV